MTGTGNQIQVVINIRFIHTVDTVSLEYSTPPPPPNGELTINH
jgi:hypothetical protein